MKYLVVLEQSSNKKSALVFDNLWQAKLTLFRIKKSFRFPATVIVKNNESFEVFYDGETILKVYIIDAFRAEYRLVSYCGKDDTEERRFSTRMYAIDFVNRERKKSTPECEDAGDWTDSPAYGKTYRLYAVITDRYNKNKVKERFDAPTVKHAVDEVKVLHGLFKYNLIKNQKNKKYGLIAGTCAAVAILAVGINIATTDWQMVEDERKASQFVASKEMKEIADNLNLTRKGRAVLFASQAELKSNLEFNKTCGRDGMDKMTFGCYYKDDDENEHIEVFNVGTSTINENGLFYNLSRKRNTTTLHEMLHAVWERQSENDKEKLCKDLRTLQNGLSDLKGEMSLYSNSDYVCSELFARVGSEYIQLLVPENETKSVYMTTTYRDLGTAERNAVNNLKEVYGKYYKLDYLDDVLVYWMNDHYFNEFDAKITQIGNMLNEKYNHVLNLKNQYYYWPSYRRYVAAMNAINDYNNQLKICRPYINTYNKLYLKIDSEAIYTNLSL